MTRDVLSLLVLATFLLGAFLFLDGAATTWVLR